MIITIVMSYLHSRNCHTPLFGLAFRPLLRPPPYQTSVLYLGTTWTLLRTPTPFLQTTPAFFVPSSIPSSHPPYILLHIFLNLRHLQHQPSFPISYLHHVVSSSHGTSRSRSTLIHPRKPSILRPPYSSSHRPYSSFTSTTLSISPIISFITSPGALTAKGPNYTR